MTQKITLTSPLFVGIDGGGSTCRARLTDVKGHVLGEGKAGSANWRLGLEPVKAEIITATQAALQQAGLEKMPLSALHVGMGLAGWVLTKDRTTIQPIKDLFASCIVSNDAYIACLGVHQVQYGGIVIVGTGSCAQIIAPEESRTFGGWGFTLGDQASGAFLGHQAVRLTLLALDMMIPASDLTDAIAASFEWCPEHCLTWSLTAKPADYARFAPLVFQYAAQNDPHALALMTSATADLVAMIKVLQAYNTGRIALLGGLAKAYEPYLPSHLLASLQKPAGNALDGALLMARKQILV